MEAVKQAVEAVEEALEAVEQAVEAAEGAVEAVEEALRALKGRALTVLKGSASPSPYFFSVVRRWISSMFIEDGRSSARRTVRATSSGRICSSGR